MGRKTNFDFLKKVDKSLFELIEDSQKLFRDEYFNQCVVQLRIFGETITKKILGEVNPNQTFDDALNCLKDRISSQREQELIDDLFFIKKHGNACAHGEDISPTIALECIKRAFEIAINFVYQIKQDEEIDKLIFSEELLILQNESNQERLVDKYLKRAQEQKEEKISKEAFLNLKQGEFNQKVEKKQEEFKDTSYVNNVAQYKDIKQNKKIKKPKKKLTPKQQEIKEKIKKAKTNLKQNINKKPKKQTKKQIQKKKKHQENLRTLILFLMFSIVAILLLSKLIF